MDDDAGIDVSLELSSVCILDVTRQIIREAKIASDPEALIAFRSGLSLPLTRVGFGAGPLSQWLYAGLQKAGFEVVLLETLHVKASLSTMIAKTVRRDARGIPNSCAWAGPAPSTANRRRRKKCGHGSWLANSCRERCTISNAACAVCCVASG